MGEGGWTDSNEGAHEVEYRPLQLLAQNRKNSNGCSSLDSTQKLTNLEWLGSYQGYLWVT